MHFKLCFSQISLIYLYDLIDNEIKDYIQNPGEVTFDTSNPTPTKSI